MATTIVWQMKMAITKKHVSYDCKNVGLYKHGYWSNTRVKEIVEVQLAYMGTQMEILQLSYMSTKNYFAQGALGATCCSESLTMKHKE